MKWYIRTTEEGVPTDFGPFGSEVQAKEWAEVMCGDREWEVIGK